MHAARALKLQRKRRDDQRRLQLLNLSPTEENLRENTFYIERLEDRRKSIAIERERGRINLLHVGLILVMIGTVMILIGCILESAYAAFEVGLVAFLFGLYVAIGCGCYRKKEQEHLDDNEHPRPVDTVYAQAPGDLETPHDMPYDITGGICNNALENFDLSQAEIVKKLKIRGYLMPKIIRGKPIFDLIPEESETMSIMDPENLSTLSSDEEGGEEENERISKRILALEQNDLIVNLTSIREEEQQSNATKITPSSPPSLPAVSASDYKEEKESQPQIEREQQQSEKNNASVVIDVEDGS